MVQDVERLSIPGHFPDVLRKGPVVKLYAWEDDHLVIARRETYPVVRLDQVLMVGYCQEVVADVSIARDYLLDGKTPIRERGMGV